MNCTTRSQSATNGSDSNTAKIVDFTPRAANVARAWLETVDARCFLSVTALRAGRALCGDAAFADTGTRFYRRRRRYVKDGDVTTVSALKKLAARHGCNEKTMRRGIEELKAHGLAARRTGRASVFVFPTPGVPCPCAATEAGGTSDVRSNVHSIVHSHLDPLVDPRGDQKRLPVQDPVPLPVTFEDRRLRVVHGDQPATARQHATLKAMANERGLGTMAYSGITRIQADREIQSIKAAGWKVCKRTYRVDEPATPVQCDLLRTLAREQRQGFTVADEHRLLKLNRGEVSEEIDELIAAKHGAAALAPRIESRHILILRHRERAQATAEANWNGRRGQR